MIDYYYQAHLQAKVPAVARMTVLTGLALAQLALVLVDALLGAAPVAHGERVGQLFVLSTGIPGRVTVLLTLNTCGSEPGPPVVHEQIGAPG